MTPREPIDSGQSDIFRSRLDQILDLGHPKSILVRQIDWQFLSEKLGEMYRDGSGQPPLSTRSMAGLHILKYTDALSDDELRALGREPLLSILLRRGVFLLSPAV